MLFNYTGDDNTIYIDIIIEKDITCRNNEILVKE